ncbi:putative WRKY transcription factor 16 [Triticum urartu]|uniref:Putative WRKY transcription factor 16 n=1 Tax=Triticum urartu TaxID=4572 RepID=M7ZPM9_TRIUA|nr:putative WRKY transcription factor 16 [Triticum urartu]
MAFFCSGWVRACWPLHDESLCLNHVMSDETAPWNWISLPLWKDWTVKKRWSQQYVPFFSFMEIMKCISKTATTTAKEKFTKVDEHWHCLQVQARNHGCMLWHRRKATSRCQKQVFTECDKEFMHPDIVGSGEICSPWVVKDFDDGVKQLADFLRKSDGIEGKTKAFFFRGWSRVALGASAVLRDVAKLLKYTICDDSDMTKHFNRIVHVDCSLWKNRRTMQRAIAKELNLRHVMPIFDRQDEEDDFVGVDVSSRKEIAITLESLWYGDPDYSTKIHHILHEVAIRVIGDTGMDGINPETVLDCFLYSLFLTAQLPQNSTGVGYGWATHACNYWICDGMRGEDKAWEIGYMLYGVIPLDECSSSETAQRRYLAHFLPRLGKGWYSVTSNNGGTNHISNVHADASSYFLTFHGNDPVYVCNDLFQLASNNLRVLKLCNCSFDFASPPFQCCSNLRFLWLEHCANTWKEQSGAPIFPNLLVFDLRFTDYVLLPQMIELMTNLRELNTKGIPWKTISAIWKKLKKLQKLRLTESSDVVAVDRCSSVDMMNLELLDLSGNTHLESLPTLSSARSLKILVLDGCSSLDQVALAVERAPPLLESFCFDGYGPAKDWTHSIHLPQKELRLKSPLAPVEIVKVTKISLHGCGRLQNIFLRALPNLEELDLSGTAIKIIDLDAMDVPKLKKLFLLGCAPSLRDCWGLRRLSVVAREGPKPVVDCEKDLWDSLEWDGLDARHHPSLFETHHSAYYKKTLPWGSYLR